MGFLQTLLIYAILFVLADLLTPKPEIEDAKPSGLGDFQFPTATEGRALPIIWGRVKIKGPNVIWYGDLVQEPIKEKVKTGLFSSQNVIRGYRYYVGIQFALCQGPVDDLTRIWNADDVIIDELSGTPFTDGDVIVIDLLQLYGGDDLGNGGLKGDLKFFNGNNTQAVSSYLASFQREPAVTGDTPHYNDICFLAPDEFRMNVGNSANIKEWAFEVRRTPDGLNLAAGPTDESIVNDGDANPMNVIYEILTNTDWGFGVATGDIDTANFITAAEILFGEGNGFSFILDRVEDLGDLIQRVEKQIDGVIFLNPLTEQWQIKLARDDYDIDLVPTLDASNCKVRTFTRSLWDGTKNQVRVPINERSDDYKDTYGFAQDMANVRIVGTNTSATIVHPGIKDKDLANAIAWRELRTLAFPLAQMTVEADRSLFGVLPGDVLAFTDTDLGFTKLAVRVKDIDFGELDSGKILINLVQDIFQATAGSFAAPPSSGWQDPSGAVVAIPASQQLIIEAPRALTFRDPLSGGATANRIYCAARLQGPEANIIIRESHATPAALPDSTFEDFGSVSLFAHIGQLDAALSPGSAYPLSTLDLNSTPSSQAQIQESFPIVTDLGELGTELLTLCYIDSATPEFILVTSAANAGADVRLNGVFRGVLDTAQGNHPINTNVFLIFVGGGISDRSLAQGDNVDIKLTPRNLAGTLADGAAVTVEFRPLQDRTRRPYPPSEFDVNGTRYDDTLVDLDGSGAGENVGVLIDEINRRDHRTAEGRDEIAALSTDADALFFNTGSPNLVADFSLTHSLVCFDGSTQLVSTGIGTADTGTIRQLDILEALDATSLPASLTFGVRATHVFETVSFDSLLDALVTSTLISDFIGKTAFGALNDSEESAGFTVAADTIDHVFTLSTILGFDVEYRLNGTGGFITLIAAGLTTGTIANALLTNSDVITIQHLDTGSGFQKLIDMQVSSVIEAYGVLIP